MKKLLPIFAVLLVALFAMACGGGSEDTAKEETAEKPAETAASGGYKVVTVANGGTITGTVTYAGAIPERTKLEITKDSAVCGKTPHYKEDLLVSSGKGVANVVVRIPNISQGKSMDTMGSEFVLDQKGCMFTPHVMIVPVGAECTILNSDGILHNIHTFSEKNDPINIAQPKFKKKITRTFDQSEVFPIKCDVHNWMGGYLVVADNPYFTKTDENGGFELTDVPAGTYTVGFWHETLGHKRIEVTVGEGASADASTEFAPVGS